MNTKGRCSGSPCLALHGHVRKARHGLAARLAQRLDGLRARGGGGRVCVRVQVSGGSPQPPSPRL